MIIQAPISVGELLDKLTILTIKLEKIVEPEKLKNVLHEHKVLKEISDNLEPTLGLSVLYNSLLQVNNQLWDIEDSKRRHEKEQLFNEEFIKLARQVYIKNDLRAKIKKEINILMGSDIVEEKSY